MNPDYEPNEFERAEKFLVYIKDKYILPADAETNLFNLLKDYFGNKSDSPASISAKRAEINRIVESLKPKS